MNFCIKDLVTFTEEILNGKLHFLCSVLISCPNNLTKNVLPQYFSPFCNASKMLWCHLIDVTTKLILFDLCPITTCDFLDCRSTPTLSTPNN